MSEHQITNEVAAPGFFSAEHVETVEHSSFARSKKVIQGPLFIPKHATLNETVAPLQAALTAVSVSIASLKKNTAYRLISSRSMYFKLHTGAGSAVVGDIYVPADQPTVVHTGTLYDTVSAIKAEGSDGIVQLVEVK